MEDDLTYTGLDILRALENAHHYNGCLVDIIVKNVAGRKTLVDFGAGIGTFARLLRARGYRVACIEPDAFLRAELTGADFETMPDLDALPDGSAKFIFSLNVFEHIADDRAILQRIYRKLADDGRLLVYVPAFQLLWSSLDDKVKHYRRYTRGQLIALAHGAGYKVTKSHYVDSLGFLAALLFRFLGNKRGELSASSIRAYDRMVSPISRIVDHVFQNVCGKNVYVVCEKARLLPKALTPQETNA